MPPLTPQARSVSAPSTRPRAIALISVIAALVAIPLVSAAPDGDSGTQGYYHVFEGRRLPMTLDTTRFAILHEGPDAPQMLGTDEPFEISGWRFRSVPAAQRNDAMIVQRVNAEATRAGGGFASPVFIGNDGGPVIVTPTLLIRIDPEIEPKAAEAMIAARLEGEVIERDWANMEGAYRVRAASRNGFEVLSAANELAQTPGVLWAEPDMAFTGRSGLVPNDPFFPSCWGLENTGQSGGLNDFDMDCTEAWEVTTGDPSIIVVIIDVGVDRTHPDINQITGEDFTDDVDLNGGPVNECDNHGTAVAGCVSGVINNNLGVVGVAPDCVIASARTFISRSMCNGLWSTNTSWTVDALAWAESIGARVSNNSNGYGFTSASIQAKYSTTRSNGMVHFASAGNDAEPEVTYPSSLPTVNSILAWNRFGNRASFSNWGEGAAFAAPGESILTTDRQGADGYVTGDYVTINGTSFASPYTAGVAALALAEDPSLTPDDVEEALVFGATDLESPGYDTDSGWGLVNARGSVLRIPGAFDILSPTCDNSLAQPVIAWADSLFADEYKIEVATDPEFTSVVLSEAGLTGNTYQTPAGALAPCVTHYLRITAFNKFGQTVSGVEPCPFIPLFTADINGDSIVDTADLGALVGNFGTSGPLGDINLDGAVDTADLGALIGQFGENCVIP